MRKKCRSSEFSRATRFWREWGASQDSAAGGWGIVVLAAVAVVGDGAVGAWVGPVKWVGVVVNWAGVGWFRVDVAWIGLGRG